MKAAKGMAMRYGCLACAVVLAALAGPASAESLRCQGGIAAEGDSRLALLYKCGQPQLTDTYCAPVYYPGTLEPVPERFARGLVPCEQIEEWLYERGPGNLVATVYLRSGIVQSIRYGRSPQ
jgi:hypothetical protein